MQLKNILLTLVVFGVVSVAYWYLVGYDNMREQKFNAMHECMEKTDWDDFDKCADEVGYD